MELKEGMYVRTKWGDVFILDKIEDNCLIPRYVYIPCIITGEDVIKTSNNIIDLIEVGDYVNGERVAYVDMEKRILLFRTAMKNLNSNWINEEDIKSIVTKEQFESMSYKVDDAKWN